jgi:hypothetical protein
MDKMNPDLVVISLVILAMVAMVLGQLRPFTAFVVAVFKAVRIGNQPPIPKTHRTNRSDSENDQTSDN